MELLETGVEIVADALGGEFIARRRASGGVRRMRRRRGQRPSAAR